MTDVLNVHEAAELLRLDRKVVYDAIRRGEIPHARIGKSIRLSRKALLKWLETGKKEGSNGQED